MTAVARGRRIERYRLALTPAGAGVLTLCFPGLLVSAASGQRSLMALSLGAALVLGANAVWALVALRSFEVTVQAPGATTVGTPVPLVVTVSGAHRLEGALGVRGGVRRWVPAQMPGSGEVLWRPPARGVIGYLTVRLQSSIPLGLAAVVREVAVALPAPVHAAPPAEAVALGPVPAGGGDGDGDPGPRAATRGGGPGDPVGVRAYVPGDAARDIHWPTVARTGGLLMVRDRPAAAGGVVSGVTVEVRAATGAALDAVAARARGAAERLARAGYRVELDSVEAGGVHVVGAVQGRDDLIVRLARIDVGRVIPIDETAVPVGAARLVVDQDGVRWRSST